MNFLTIESKNMKQTIADFFSVANVNVSRNPSNVGAETTDVNNGDTRSMKSYVLNRQWLKDFEWS